MSKTPISILQELAVQRKYALPDYYFESCSDKPGASFECIVKIDKVFKTCGYGSTKKEAKQNSAQKALELMGFTSEIQESVYQTVYTTINIFPKNRPFINYVGKLNEYASTHGASYPTYIDHFIPVNGKFVTDCCFLKWKTEGHGLKKKDSKQDAARTMLEKLRTEDVTIITEKLQDLKIEKLEKIDRLTQEILENYSRLSALNKKTSSNHTEIKPIPNLKKNTTNLEELRSEMQKYGYKYTLETFQSAPYIMKMKITDTDAVLMGNGMTKEEALTDLYETAVLMLSHGFTMSTEF